VHRQCTCTLSRPKHVAHQLAVQLQRSGCAATVRRFIAGSFKGAARDADRWNPEDGTKVEGQAGAPGVVATAGVHEQYVEPHRQVGDRVRKQRTLAQSEVPGRVGRSGKPAHRDLLPARRGGRPPRLTGDTRPGAISCETNETPADHEFDTTGNRLLPRRREIDLYAL
jgi:hypothetical protein